MLNTFLSIAALAVLAACSQAPKKETAHFCDPSGCQERSTSRSDMANAEVRQFEVSPDVAALEELAQANPKAAHDLALKYFRGEGVPQNTHQSLKWMRHAGERGQLEAQKALGLIYLSGLEEMGADPAEAEKWLKIAASRGDKESEALVLEANRAKQANQQEWKNQQYWRKNAHRYWFYDYPYFGRWRHNRWWY